jgi:hypothetical protein
MMDLPPALEGLFWDDVTRIQQEKHMPFITTPERIGIRKGLMEGIEALLEVRFGAEGLQVMPEVRAVQDAEKLRALLQTIKTATNLDEVRRGWPK